MTRLKKQTIRLRYLFRTINEKNKEVALLQLFSCYG